MAPETDPPSRLPRWHWRRLWEKAQGWPVVTHIRSSLSMRAALTITVAGVLVIFLFGAVVAAQMRTGFFEGRRTQVLEDAALRFSSAQAVFDQSTASSPDQVQEAARQMVESIKTSAAGAGATSVVLLRSEGVDQGVRINEIVDASVDGVITDAMRESVTSTGIAHWQSVEIPSSVESGGDPAILVGMEVRLPRAGAHELYIVYSLADDQAMVNMVMRILTLAAIPVLVVLPLGAYWMLHQLMRPVRRTSEAAIRLAGGDLEVRVPESGSDEMSHLATAFNDMAASLQRQISEYDTLSQLQQRFVSDVSHELRTPLTTIRMAEEMIWQDREDLQPLTKRSAELLHEQVERFESMLADLLEISRYDAQSALLDPETTDLRPVVTKVVAANKELADRLGVQVNVHLPDHRCPAEIDVRRIERVLRNLLVNAIEHADGTDVDIHVAATDTDVAVRVRDHGVGMSAEVAGRVFDRFYRADPARTRTTGGTGLGLSIATEDVGLHGGLLQAQGEPGNGASFLMTLPRHAGNAPISRPLDLWEDA